MTRSGNSLYNISIKDSIFLNNHKWLYYILNLTWGLLMTIIGYIIALIMLITFHKPRFYKGVMYFISRKINGGFSVGMVLVVCNESDALKNHEIGHTYQNAIFGIFMPFIVSIPSMIRYWYIEHQEKKGKEIYYDGVWFEKSATDIGNCVSWMPKSSNKTQKR